MLISPAAASLTLTKRVVIVRRDWCSNGSLIATNCEIAWGKDEASVDAESLISYIWWIWTIPSMAPETMRSSSDRGRTIWGDNTPSGMLYEGFPTPSKAWLAVRSSQDDDSTFLSLFFLTFLVLFQTIFISQSNSTVPLEY